MNCDSIGRLVHGEDPRFLAELAESLSVMITSHRRSTPTDSKKHLLDQERMVDLHFTILNWLLHGGHASAARAWSRTTIRSEPIVEAVNRARGAA